MDDTVSIVDTNGFPNPAVEVVDASLETLEVPATTAAVPPPAIIANDQVTTGFKSTIVDAITVVPAIAAKGTAILSSKLSIYGI